MFGQVAIRGCLLAGMCLALYGKLAAEESMLFSSVGGTVYGQAVGVTAITIGDDPDAPPQIVLFSGLLEITKSPDVESVGGLKRATASLDSRLTNDSETLGVRSARMPGIGFVQIWVDPDPAHPSVGFLTQSPPDEHDHEAAEGHFELYLVFQMGPDFGQLRNREPVVLSAHIHQIPPITHPIKLTKNMTPEDLVKMMDEVGETNKWEGINLPVALYDNKGIIRAYFTPKVHQTVLTGACGDGVDNDMDGRKENDPGGEEFPDNIDNDDDGFVDEDSTCP